MVTLKEIAEESIISEFEHLKGFCNYDENYLDDGVALKNKVTGRIRCFQWYDFHRGRGDIKDWGFSGCKYFCYVLPNHTRTTLLDFINDQLEKRK